MAMMGFSFSSSWPRSLSLIFVFGLGQAMRMTLGNTLVQYYAEEKYRGRVMSIYTMDFSITSFGAFGAALLAERVGIQWAVGSFAMALILITLLVAVFVPRIRRLD
jgi:MFS family permease